MPRLSISEKEISISSVSDWTKKIPSQKKFRKKTQFKSFLSRRNLMKRISRRKVNKGRIISEIPRNFSKPLSGKYVRGYFQTSLEG